MRGDRLSPLVLCSPITSFERDVQPAQFELTIMPNLYVIGGPNGAGKTTVALQLLPNRFNLLNYVNADAIASGLSPLDPESMAIQAGRLMLERLQALASSEVDFAFETTLAARTFVPFLRNCRQRGYGINLLFFWLRSPELAIARVARRVASGGHSIPQETIRRRYQRGQKNLIELYLPLCDSWIVYDNSGLTLALVAEGNIDQSLIVYDLESWKQIGGVSE